MNHFRVIEVCKLLYCKLTACPMVSCPIVDTTEGAHVNELYPVVQSLP